MKESDWKVFTELKDKAIEKYCTLVIYGAGRITRRNFRSKK
ncbi:MULTISPECIES: hypothetical protein [unclassified Colwellia]|nr:MULTISPECIES: hypothetical protein [unclassified Colwellia]